MAAQLTAMLSVEILVSLDYRESVAQSGAYMYHTHKKPIDSLNSTHFMENVSSPHTNKRRMKVSHSSTLFIL